ncbi:PAS domain S-box-containing protein [Natronorubrum sediminis]|uniref:PAS domain S-box-containing protein n=1 Tax=Natronorubrum sediminis TaxID=640943 RepID=A0A1H6G4N8_9EURY|nr:bacterio-opsin activator domain-containing protein [Natronorubrum sediminis]SEH18047.1 PAS domain S-box-containing protein [Natronorubrum sediminis]
MSDSPVPTGDVLRVLVVGDSSQIDATMATLSSQFDSVSLVRERSLASALERLARLDIHCVVCQFDPDSGEPPPIAGIRTRSDSVPIVAVTGHAADARREERALEAGASVVVDSEDPASLVGTRVKTAARQYQHAMESDGTTESILERSDALVCVLDESATIVSANGAVDERLGYTPAELEGTPLAQLVHPDDRERVQTVFERVSRGALGANERVSARIGRGDGTWSAAELSARNRLADPRVTGVVLTLLPVSSPATGAADSTQTVLDSIDDPLFTLGPQWEIRQANAAARDLFETTDSSPTGTVIWDLLDERVRSTFYERALEAARTNSAVEFETPYPSLETRLAVTVSPHEAGVVDADEGTETEINTETGWETDTDGDSDTDTNTGFTVHARAVPPDGSTAVDRTRFDLLESVVDALGDGVLVLEGETISFANATTLELTEDDTLVGRGLEAVFDDALAAAIHERARSPLVRWMDPLTGTLTAGDDSVPVDVFVTPLSADDRTLCVVRDRTRSPAGTLETLESATDEIRDAESFSDVTSAVLEAILEYSGGDLGAWYRLDDDALRPETVVTPTSRSPGELASIDRDTPPLSSLLEHGADGSDSSGRGESGTVDPPEITATVFDRAECESLLTQGGLRAERLLVVPLPPHGIALVASSDPLAFERIDREPLLAIGRVGATALDALESAADRRATLAENRRLETALERCQRLREHERDILACDSRGEIERTCCEAATSIPLEESAGAVELAWIGRIDTGSERIVPEAWAGDDVDDLEPVAIPADTVDPRRSKTDDASLEGTHPAALAATTLEPVVVDAIDADGTQPDQGWRRRALEEGRRSALAVPLVVDGRCYGMLTAFADTPSAFDDSIRERYLELATVTSYALAADERKRALLADRLTELEVAVRRDDDGDGDALSAIAHEVGGELTVQAIVPRATGASTVYCAVRDDEAGTAQSVVDAIESVETGRRVGDESEPLYEFVLAEPTVAESLATHGARVQSVAPAGDRTRFVLEVPRSTDVRSILEVLERTSGDVDLLARRDRDRSIHSGQPFDADLRRTLSERQLRTLEAAYYGGFFAWPRESTGEEVADSLGVSQPTFSRHLRVAQGKVFSSLFDDRA